MAQWLITFRRARSWGGYAQAVVEALNVVDAVERSGIDPDTIVSINRH